MILLLPVLDLPDFVRVSGGVLQPAITTLLIFVRTNSNRASMSFESTCHFIVRCIAFKQGTFALPWEIHPDVDVVHCCGTKVQGLRKKTSMTVYSSLNVMHTQFLSLECEVCKTLFREDGKEYGILIVNEEVRT